MKTVPSANQPLGHEAPSIFGDPWNTPVSTAVKVRTTLAVLVFLALVFLFATAVSAWVSSLGPEPAQARPAAALKSNDAAGADVAVLAPPGMTPAQADEFSENLRIMPDGFFSSLSLPSYDVVVNGSLRRSAAADTAVRVSETETGLAVMFARDGAEYLVEFSCRGPGSETGVRCVTDAEARELVAGFAVFDAD